MKRFVTFVSPLLFSLVFSSCGNGEKLDDALITDDTRKSVMASKLNAQNVFNSMPDRKQVLKLIEENKIEYNSDLLNDPTLVNKYTVESSKAVNLGIYGSDLTIASSFDQTQESMVFLKCVNILASNLGINGAFDQKMFDRMETNKQNKDSTLEVITSAFKNADEILKANHRPATSAIILAGAWIEGFYVSCRIATDLKSDGIVKSIIEQKESLKNLVVMLDEANLDEGSKYILTDLKSLLESYDAIGNTTSPNLDTIKDIIAKASALRTKIVSGNPSPTA